MTSCSISAVDRVFRLQVGDCEVKPLIGPKLISDFSRLDALAVVRHLVGGKDSR